MERRLYVDPNSFAPLGVAQQNGWRDRVPERGQTFAEFAASAPNRPQPSRRRLYILPLGTFPNEMVVEAEYVALVRAPPLEHMAELLRRFFGLPVTIMDPRRLDALDVSWRDRKGHRQYRALPLLAAVAELLPADAYSMTTIINRDLVVADRQEYAFGYGLHRERLAVMSSARFDPLFGGLARPPGWQASIDRRGLLVLAHEVAHTFGLRHCTYYACALNGMSHPAEVDATPMHLCPVCLRKLVSLGTVDPVTRYARLGEFYRDTAMNTSAEWVAQRLAHIRDS